VKTSTIIIIVVIAVVILGGAGLILGGLYLGKSTTNTATPSRSASTTKTTSTSGVPASVNETELDQVIKSSATGMAAPGIEGVNITDKKYYSAPDGTIWLKYVVTPIPENAADPGTGIMKKVPGNEWESVNFGTAGLATGLPADVVEGLEITD